MKSPAARIAAVIAAAGESRRFGSAKLLATVSGVPLVARTVSNVLQAHLHQTLVVLGHHAGDIRNALSAFPVQFTENADPARGLGSSIAAGVRTLDADVDATFVILADQPTVDARILATLSDAWFRTRADVIVPEFQGQRAPPVLFGRAVFPELIALTGDAGAREVVDRDPDRVHVVSFEFAVPPDIDTLADLDRLQRSD